MLGAASGRGDDFTEAMSKPSSDPQDGGGDRIGAAQASPPLEPGLYVVSTPIGNLRDITLRALDTLGAASRVYAEDTRVARKLLDAYGLKPRLAAYHEHNAEAARAEILAALAQGESVALIPTRYPGAREAASDALRLARRTEWKELDADTFIGSGQRMWTTDTGETALLDVRHVELLPAASG